MKTATLKSIEGASFRANPGYELVPFDRLSREEQASLEGHRGDPNFFGILRPVSSDDGWGIKIVDPETALLFLTLALPGPLPHHVKARLGDECNQSIAQLVLDNVIQIERWGRFVSGASSHPYIYAELPSATKGGPLSLLSQAAVRYAQELQTDSAMELSMRMYLYNRLPASPRRCGELPDEVAVAAMLGFENNVDLQRHWRPEGANEAWFAWRSKRRGSRDRTGYVARNGGVVSGRDVTYKIYVSPRPESLAEAFRLTVSVLTQCNAPVFKVGRNLSGVLRPDKLVAYFWTEEEMRAAGDALVRALDGLPVHGVPFTADLGAGGLVSAGIDPAPEKYTLVWQDPQSWRLWVTNRLAAALLAARKDRSAELPPWQFALERIRLEGIDTVTWTPVAESTILN